MQQLLKDYRQREEAIAAERAGWERAADRRIEAMQAQTDALMALVRDSQRPGHGSGPPAPARPFGGVPQVKLVPLTEQDNIEAYLVTFERVMQAYDIPNEQWTCHWNFGPENFGPWTNFFTKNFGPLDQFF